MHPALGNIALLTRILRFTVQNSAKRLAVFACVTMTFRTALLTYAAPFNLKLLLTGATLYGRYHPSNFNHRTPQQSIAARFLRAILLVGSSDFVEAVLQTLSDRAKELDDYQERRQQRRRDQDDNERTAAVLVTTRHTLHPLDITELKLLAVDSGVMPPMDSPEYLSHFPPVAAGRSFRMNGVDCHNNCETLPLLAARNHNSNDPSGRHQVTAVEQLARFFPTLFLSKCGGEYTRLRWTALDVACFHRNVAAVKWMLEQYITQEINDCHGVANARFTRAFRLIAHRYPQRTQLSRTQKRMFRLGIYGYPTILVACMSAVFKPHGGREQQESVAIVRALLEQNRRLIEAGDRNMSLNDPDLSLRLGHRCRSNDGTTALHLACETHNLELIKFILEDNLGGDKQRISAALRHADFLDRHPPMFRLFPIRRIKSRPGGDPQFDFYSLFLKTYYESEDAAHNNNNSGSNIPNPILPIVKYLCEVHRVDVMEQQQPASSSSVKHGDSILHHACRAFALLHAGSWVDELNIHRKHGSRNHQYHTLVLCRHAIDHVQEVIVYLVQRRFRTRPVGMNDLASLSNSRGLTCLHIAVMYDSIDLVRLLLALESANQKNSNNTAPPQAASPSPLPRSLPLVNAECAMTQHMCLRGGAVVLSRGCRIPCMNALELAMLVVGQDDRDTSMSRALREYGARPRLFKRDSETFTRTRRAEPATMTLLDFAFEQTTSWAIRVVMRECRLEDIRTAFFDPTWVSGHYTPLHNLLLNHAPSKYTISRISALLMPLSIEDRVAAMKREYRTNTVHGTIVHMFADRWLGPNKCSEVDACDALRYLLNHAVDTGLTAQSRSIRQQQSAMTAVAAELKAGLLAMPMQTSTVAAEVAANPCSFEAWLDVVSQQRFERGSQSPALKQDYTLPLHQALWYSAEKTQ